MTKFYKFTLLFLLFALISGAASAMVEMKSDKTTSAKG